MTSISKSLLLAAGIVVFSSLHADQPIPCTLVDLSGHEAVVYDPFLRLLSIAGFQSTYTGLHTFVDEAEIIEDIATKQKGIFLVVAADLLANINVSPIGAKLKQLLARVAQVPNFFVGLLLPSFNGVKQNMALLPALHDLFAPLGIATNPILLQELERRISQPINTRDLIAAAIDFFLKNPMSMRPMPFHTTLNLPRGGNPFQSRLLRAAHHHKEQSLTFLPAHAKRFVSQKLVQTLPYFVYAYSPVRHSKSDLPGVALAKPGSGIHVLVGSEMLVSGLGITEQFHIRPLKTSYAREMLDLIGLAMAQFRSLVVNAQPAKKNFHAIVRSVTKPDFTAVVNSFGKVSGDDDKHVLRKVAWMELTMFEPLTPDQAKKMTAQEQVSRQAELIEYLIKSAFDGLWITFNPHQYWSPIARKKAHEPAFLTSVQLFTKRLAAACNKAKKPYPALLVGFEITNNVYLPNLPKMCGVDTFGNEFTDIPAPLHEQFWRDEVINPLQELVRRWNEDKKLSNGIPLKGVVLDLEMYCRKRTGSFNPGIGFDTETIVAFDPLLLVVGAQMDSRHPAHPEEQRSCVSKEVSGVPHHERPEDLLVSQKNSINVHNVVQKLMDTKRYSAFLAARTAGAKQLGLTMRTAFKQALGNDAYIMCYAQNLMIDWFYKGLYQGLSTKEEPLELLTFNAEFMRHRPWLEQQGIYVNHGCVVLLSKLASPKEFGYVNYVRQAHQSVWLNRVSRLAENYEQKSWIGVEQTPMDRAGKLKLARHLATVE